jgi:rod shape-determining protein MreB
MPIFDVFSNDVAIDLGTANTLIYIRDKGIVLNEPSIIAVERSNPRHVVEIGMNALMMHERTHKEIITIRPLKDGVIADFESAELLIRGLIRKIQKNWYTSIRRMVICVPSGITEVEKRAVRDSAEHAGAKQVYLVEEPMAAAIGIGLDVMEPVGNMVVDIGGGTTEIAVIALSGIVVDESIRVGGDELDAAIVQAFRKNHNLLIGERTAELIKKEIGSAIELDPELELSVRGRDLVTGIPRVRTVSSEDVREALTYANSQIVAAVMRALERTPPELGGDVLERGIMLTGGGALLKGLDELIRSRVELPVYVAEDPLTAVARGTGAILENLEYYSKVRS